MSGRLLDAPLHRLIRATLEGTNIGPNSNEMIVTESGLQYRDIVVGTGEEPKEGGSVTVHYSGSTSYLGKPIAVFDDSRARGYPFKFVMGEGKVIPGWEEGIKGMKTGGRRKLVIPAELGYGDKEAAGGRIPANSEIQFDCELLAVGAEGQGSFELGLEDAKTTFNLYFQNKLFSALTVVWIISFFLPKDFFESNGIKF